MPRLAPRLLCLFAAAALFASGCGGDGEDGGADGGGERAASTEETTTTADAATAGDGGTKVWFTAGEQFQPVERDVGGVEPAVGALLEGPTDREVEGGLDATTQIPEGTTLEGVSVDDGTAVVRVSGEFTADIPADPGSRTAEQRQDLSARLAQVTYTATQFPEVEATKVVSGGVPVEAGGPTGPGIAKERADYAAPEQGPKQLRKAKGDRVPGTRQIQKRLAQLRYLPKDAVDGLNGYRTQQAVMAFQSWEGLGRDGVVGPQTSAALATATKPKPRPGSPGKRIEVYIQKGVTLLVKGGRLRRAIHSSAGAPGTDTPTGRYEVFRKELRSWSVPFSTWLPYASYFNNGIAFHEYPDVPPYPASHGCVRLPAPEAPGVYDFAAIGTTVVVYP